MILPTDALLIDFVSERHMFYNTKRLFLSTHDSDCQNATYVKRKIREVVLLSPWLFFLPFDGFLLSLGLMSVQLCLIYTTPMRCKMWYDGSSGISWTISSWIILSIVLKIFLLKYGLKKWSASQTRTSMKYVN